ncbi:helix-turn-helix domain-containing protein [Actibacterium sp. 188UL27-1]|uniref:helix-turn-helix domain-containing protein n=1 Tax=Actibacterium sp. 188UL27-1 TaxID=2786961 RepID=UPI0019590CFB|nr:XRE family transcriptional regulator [Actibacterium sp. 188UL27-1]MBM7066804.1 helix-turn-helix transcriptional regulator [Actibacterium sp. 188UL27-1]
MSNEAFHAASIGGDLRALRKVRGLTLQQAAQHMSRSTGWMSQVERGLSAPSAGEVQRLAALYDVPVSMVLGETGAPEPEQGRVVRADARRPIGQRVPGMVEELLSPDLTDSFEVIHTTFHPHTGIDTPRQRPTEEIGYILSGRLNVTIGGHPFQVKRGDSFRIRAEPYLWENPYATAAQALWVIAPPLY